MKKINWRYALGEILIVIIGITIAFSINTCAENSKQNKEKQQYLANLKKDISADKIQLEQNIKALESKMGLSEKVLPILNSDSKEKMSIIKDIFSLAQISSFDANDVTYQTLINSGDLKLIDDFELRTAIESHYATYEEMAKDYERQEIIHKEYLGRYFIYNIDYESFRKGVFGFEDEKLLKNIIQSMRGSFQLKLNATKNGIESCSRLLLRLEKVSKI